MSDMIERVAKAIAAASLDASELPISDDLLKVAYEPLARAAIEVMREPTRAMVGAAWDRTNERFQTDDDLYSAAWEAMIDAALSRKDTQ